MRYPVFLLSFLLLSTMLRSVDAQAVIAPPIRPSPHGVVAAMAKELNLSDDQVTRLIEKFAEQQTAVTNWNATHREQLDQLKSCTGHRTAGRRQSRNATDSTATAHALG